MPQQQLEQTSPISMLELKELSGSQGPCITVLFPLHHEDTRQAGSALKNAIRTVQQRLEERHVDRKQIETLMAPLRANDMEADPEQKGVVILRSPDVFHRFFIPQEISESVSVGDRFNLLPLLPVLSENRPFYILALSQKHIRLLRCTNTTSEEVSLPPSVPHDLDSFLQTDRPDHMLDNASSGGPGTGSMQRVMFGTVTDAERKDKRLLHFYKAVDRGITDLLRTDTAPVVIAGVDYELPMYRSVSEFPRLVGEPVRGAPDGLKGGELHKRALDVVGAYWRKSVDDALAMYEQFGGSNRASISLTEIVKAAYDGRVFHLFIAQGARVMGRFDEMTREARTTGGDGPGDEDLVNAAAVETLRHGGNVFVLPANRIPQGSQTAAVMRY